MYSLTHSLELSWVGRSERSDNSTPLNPTQLKMFRTRKKLANQLSWVKSGRQSVPSARFDSTQPVELSWVESGALANWALVGFRTHLKSMHFFHSFIPKTICWPNLGCALRRVVCRCRSHIHSEAGTSSSCSAMTEHYHTTSAAAVAWTSESSFPVSAMLLIYTLLITCQSIK